MLDRGVVCRVAAGLAMAVLVQTPAGAQPAEGDTAMPSGTRVRVTVNRPGAEAIRLTGDLKELGPESLTLAVRSSGAREIPLPSVVRLERRVQKGRKTRGALIGFGVGFSALFLLSETGNDETCFRGGHECGFQIMASAVLALPAAAVGMIVAPGDKWEEVPLGSGPGRTRSSAGLELRIVPMVGKAKGLTLVGSF